MPFKFRSASAQGCIPTLHSIILYTHNNSDPIPVQILQRFRAGAHTSPRFNPYLVLTAI